MKKLTIIGGGPAGYAAALYAHNFDLEITLIESDVLGGTCLNRGCIMIKLTSIIETVEDVNIPIRELMWDNCKACHSKYREEY